MNHLLLGEIVRRTYRNIHYEKIIDPFKLHDTSVGLEGAAGTSGLFGCSTRMDSSIWVTAISERTEHSRRGTAVRDAVGRHFNDGRDLFRFAEMLRRGGELDGDGGGPITTCQMLNQPPPPPPPPPPPFSTQ